MKGGQPHRQRADQVHAGQNFLPNFCDVRMAFIVVMIAELLAFILTLGPTHLTGSFWGDLGLISLQVQWMALSGASLLCLLRKPLARLTNNQVALVSYLLLQVTTIAISLLSLWVVKNIGLVAVLGDHWARDLVWHSVAISTIVSAIVLRYLYVQHQWKLQVQAEAEARIQALQARIRPHFLFNSMNIIASLTQSNPQQAERVVEDLADLFRATLSDARELVPLKDEIELIRRYLNIESLRLGSRLRVKWDIEALPLETLVPALILQPLIENSIYHGIEPRPDGGTIEIGGTSEGNTVIIRICNPLPQSSNLRHQHGNHMALDNIRHRLAMHFGEQAQLETQDTSECYEVRLILPRGEYVEA